uniref:Uncharacterized protein n=1 Tax=Romanomermis culicivorax TaxID=13658 RepID=A0A915HGB7_ROMCU
MLLVRLLDPADELTTLEERDDRLPAFRERLFRKRYRRSCRSSLSWDIVQIVAIGGSVIVCASTLSRKEDERFKEVINDEQSCDSAWVAICAGVWVPTVTTCGRCEANSKVSPAIWYRLTA